MDPLVEAAFISGAATLIGVGGTVVVAIVGFRTSRATNEATIAAAHADVRHTLDVARQEQMADRYLRAVDQLGSDIVEVRTGAIYALERVAQDRGGDDQTVMEVLATFVRERSRVPWPKPGTPIRGQELPFPSPDVQAALTVIGRRNVMRDDESLDLAAAVLPGALLFGADLTRIRLVDADLRGIVAHPGAKFRDADLRNADLTLANLTGADLTGADLTGANVARTILTGAQWPENVPAPTGWIRDSSSAKLQGTNSDVP